MSKPISILYVEDEPAIRDVMVECLTTMGYHVTPAEEGHSALEHFKRAKLDPANTQFSLIITDINMPGMDGIKLIKEIHQLDQEIPIFAISGYLKNSEYVKELPQGIIYYSKPVRVKDLSAKIQEVVK